MVSVSPCVVYFKPIADLCDFSKLNAAKTMFNCIMRGKAVMQFLSHAAKFASVNIYNSM